VGAARYQWIAGAGCCVSSLAASSVRELQAL
jgi:hypothetical protein